MTRLYAVAIGRSVGLFHNWDVVHSATNGFHRARHKGFSLDEFALAYQFAYGRPWDGPHNTVIVFHPEGWAALVDPAGDVPAQLAAADPAGAVRGLINLGDGTTGGLRASLFAAGIQASGGSSAVLAAVDKAVHAGQISPSAAVRLRRVVRTVAEADTPTHQRA